MPAKRSAVKAAKTSSKKFVKFGGLQIPMWEGKHHPLIPEFGAEIWYPKEQMKAIATALLGNISTLLIGETGTGKTSLIRQIAYLRQQPYVRVNLHGYTSPDELIGSKSAANGSTFFEDGVIIQAMRMGAILVVDELNAATPDCMFIFHALLDDERKITLPTGEVVRPHPEFRFFATMNPDYEGTKSINRAFLDRFGVVIDVETLAPALEEKYLMQKGASKEDANNMVLFASAYRAAYRDGKTLTFCSTRTLLQWLDLIQRGFAMEKAFLFAVLGKSRAEEKQAMADVFEAQVKKNLKLTSRDKLVVVKKSELTKAEKIATDMQNKASDLAIELDRAKAHAQAQNNSRAQAVAERDQLQTAITELTSKMESFTQLKRVLKKLKDEGIIDAKSKEDENPF